MAAWGFCIPCSCILLLLCSFILIDTNLWCTLYVKAVLGPAKIDTSSWKQRCKFWCVFVWLFSPSPLLGVRPSQLRSKCIVIVFFHNLRAILNYISPLDYWPPFLNLRATIDILCSLLFTFFGFSIEKEHHNLLSLGWPYACSMKIRAEVENSHILVKFNRLSHQWL